MNVKDFASVIDFIETEMIETNLSQKEIEDGYEIFKKEKEKLIKIREKMNKQHIPDISNKKVPKPAV